MKAFEKQRARQQVKEASPEYKVQKTKAIKSKPIKSKRNQIERLKRP